METAKHTILNHEEIQHKIRRIAYQIYEANVDEEEIVIAGISLNGFILAKKIAVVLAEISTIEIVLCEVFLDKRQPLSPVKTSLTVEEYTDKSVVLIDDVLNSGSTLIYGVKHFLEVSLKNFKTAVLVNRNHKKYPVKADFKGISLSTSLREHVNVVFSENEDVAYLE